MSYKIYHNPKCTKSRETLKLLEDNNIKPEVVKYLETPLNTAEIKNIIDILGVTARDIIRKGEDEYKDNNLTDKTLSDDKLVNYIAKYPKLLERPIVIKGKRGVIGRPPENVLKLL